MKIRATCMLALLSATGCHTAPKSPPITSEQAMTMAVQLANDKCDALYQKRPFQPGNLLQFTGGRWVWTDTRGVGVVDVEARVELAADGSTNRVDVKVLDNRILLKVMF